MPWCNIVTRIIGVDMCQPPITREVQSTWLSILNLTVENWKRIRGHASCTMLHAAPSHVYSLSRRQAWNVIINHANDLIPPTTLRAGVLPILLTSPWLELGICSHYHQFLAHQPTSSQHGWYGLCASRKPVLRYGLQFHFCLSVKMSDNLLTPWDQYPTCLDLEPQIFCICVPPRKTNKPAFAKVI